MERFRVLLSSFQCKSNGISESYVGYKWLEQIARFNDVTLLTADETTVPEGVQRVNPSKRIKFPTKLLRNLNGEAKFDYFWFNSRAKKAYRKTIRDYDLVHHVAPIAPRYPCSLGVIAKKFIIGPIGGGQRVPPGFRPEVEKSEEFYFKLRRLDRVRLKFDPVLRKTFRAAHRILIVGKYMYDILPEEFHAKCVPMLETGVDTATIPFVPMQETTGRAIHLLYAGRVVPYKGLIYALRALAALPPAARAAVRFHIVGDRDEGTYEKECRQLVAEQHLTGTVLFHGRKSKDQVFEFYRQCDLLVFPSLAETSGNVILESMCIGRPVLAFDCGGPAEMVTPEAGYLVEASNPEQAVRALKEVLTAIVTAPEELVAKGIAARRLVEDKFDWARKGVALRNIYEEVLGEVFCSVQNGKSESQGCQ